ncbi:MAG TPA: hypothetical protein VK098_01365 [Beutenbergiaceae bacterium]|nr:hypothetical protein [Beutenbergiaceae bacterium]
MKLFGKSAISAAGAAGLLMLAACSAGEFSPPTPSSTPEDGVLEFPLPEVEPRERWRIEVPQDLQEAAQADGLLLVTGVEVQGRELEESGCAMELTVEYARGSTDAEPLAQPTPSSAEADAALERHQERFLESFDVATSAEFDEKYHDETPASGTGFDEHLHEYWAQGRYATWADVRRAYFDEVEAEFQQEVEEAARSSDVENVGDNLGFFSPRPLTTYDDLSPEGGTYISDDYRTILVVQDCAFVPSDSKEDYPDFEANTLRFPFDEESRDGTSALASVALTVVAGGKVAVLDGDVHGWAKESGGTWERGTR